MDYFGNKDLLKLYKTGFLSSRKCPAEIVLKSYEWAKKQREEGNCVICGNHSQIENDVFNILLKGNQPLILVLPRGLKKRWNKKILENVEQGRLLIITPFGKEVKRITRTTAIQKNQTIVRLSDKIVTGYVSKNGQLDGLIKNYSYYNV
jgi:predicted Rossmann fold nucleotide-binding protein DprA/Smf involved in DNA uptake